MRKHFTNFAAGLMLALGLPFLALQPALAQTMNSSRNWAGYIVQNGNYTAVSGSWVVPTVTGPSSTSADAEWVGIGGVTSTDLIQAGTQGIVDNTGQVTYEAWVETLPQVSESIPLTVKPGDLISVSINEQSANLWHVNFNDNSTGQNYQTNLSYISSHSSADWIVEAPAAPGGFLPLDNFGTVQFTNASTVQNGQTLNLSQSGAGIINMLNNNQQTLATVSGLNADGASFSVSRTSAASAQTPLVIHQGRGWRRPGGSGQNSPIPRQASRRFFSMPGGNGMSFRFFIFR